MSLCDVYRAVADVLEDLESRGVEVRTVTAESETVSADDDGINVTLAVRIPAEVARTERADGGEIALEGNRGSPSIESRAVGGEKRAAVENPAVVEESVDEGESADIAGLASTDAVASDTVAATVDGERSGGKFDTRDGEERDERTRGPPDASAHGDEAVVKDETAVDETATGDEAETDETAAEAEADGRIECTHEDCPSAFDSEHGMKIHRSKVHGDSDGDEPPAYADPTALREVYERYDTFAEMTDALAVAVTPKTVRQHMIEHGIHESGGTVTEEDGEVAENATDVATDERMSDNRESNAETEGDDSDVRTRTSGDQATAKQDGTATDPEESAANQDETATTESATAEMQSTTTSVAAAAPRAEVRPATDETTAEDAPTDGTTEDAVTDVTTEDVATDDTDPADEPTGANRATRIADADGDGPADETADGAEPEPADDYTVPDDVDLPTNVSIGDVVDAVQSANTVFEVGRDLRMSRERARKLLRELDLLDLVTGRLASRSDRAELQTEIDERLRALADGDSSA